MTERRRIPWGAVAIVAVAAVSCGGMLIAGIAMMRPAKNATPADALYSRVQAIRALPTTARDCTPAFDGKQPVVVIVMGQGNAANHAGAPRDGVPQIPVLHDGGCGMSAGPLPGATGTGGSLWPAVSQALHGQWGGRPILWSVMAVDETSITEWLQPEGALRKHWQRQLDGVKATGFPVAAVLWQQGEADARDRTAMIDYRDGIEAMRAAVIRRGIDAPWWLAKSTYCPPHDGGQVREAVRQLLVSPETRFVAGPDLDAIDGPLRQGCYVTADGAVKAAALWADVLVPAAKSP